MIAKLPEKARSNALSITHIGRLFSEWLHDRESICQHRQSIYTSKSQLLQELESIESAITELSIRKSQVQETLNALNVKEQELDLQCKI